jgi:hypothetical protein
MNIEFIQHALSSSTNQTLMITSFVLTMMLLIEYINVQTKSLLNTSLKDKPFGQILLGAILGITPGCLGAYTTVSLYTHRAVGFAAVVTTMIATSGDEAFVMFSMIPKAAIKLHLLIFVIAILSGIIVYKFIKKKDYTHKNEPLPYHKDEPDNCTCFNSKTIIYELKNMTFTRFLLIVGALSFLYLILFSVIGPQTWNWKKWIFVSSGFFMLFVFLTTPNHFLEEHIWNHIIKKHFFRVFLWTFVTILAINLFIHDLNITNFIHKNTWIILLSAVLIGIIPESGPHLIFVTLFAKGLIPFPILLASSIVQDGHGMLPLLAESFKDFIWIKLINVVIGFTVGAIGLLLM